MHDRPRTGEHVTQLYFYKVTLTSTTELHCRTHEARLASVWNALAYSVRVYHKEKELARQNNLDAPSGNWFTAGFLVGAAVRQSPPSRHEPGCLHVVQGQT